MLSYVQISYIWKTRWPEIKDGFSEKKHDDLSLLLFASFHTIYLYYYGRVQHSKKAFRY